MPQQVHDVYLVLHLVPVLGGPAPDELRRQLLGGGPVHDLVDDAEPTLAELLEHVEANFELLAGLDGDQSRFEFGVVICDFVGGVLVIGRIHWTNKDRQGSKEYVLEHTVYIKFRDLINIEKRTIPSSNKIQASIKDQ